MRTRVAFALAAALGPCATAGAETLASFDDGFRGSVAGSASGAASATCRATDVATSWTLPGRAEIIAAPPSLGAADPQDRVLLVGTEPATGGDALAQTRWELTFEAREASLLRLRAAFVTSDLGAMGDWWALLLDGEPFACGDARTAEFLHSGALTPEDRATAWRDLGGGLPVDPGVHVLQVVVADGTDSLGASALLLDDVHLASAVPPPTPCMPAPPADVGEIAFMPGSNPERWTFDDNRFCSGGPELSCARCLSGAPTPCEVGDPEVNPNLGFVDSTDRSFEMYIVADCGREMHLPLADVESGCISVFDETRFPVDIEVSNGFGFFATGGEVCWSATDCTGGGLNEPGGPGDRRVMDVSFAGNPALCGVFIVNFRSWAGCIWDLYANCDGTGSEGFRIYEDFCEAQAAVNLLPEIVIDSMLLSSGAGCFVDYCVVVQNIGCQTAGPFTVRVENESGFTDHQVTLGAGSQTQVCGRLNVIDVGPVSPTTVTATADFGDAVLECTEAPGASACDPAPGADVRSRSTNVECNRTPDCDPGGPYANDCPSPGGRIIVLDATGSIDADGDALSHAWTTDCPDATIADPTAPVTELTVPGSWCGTCRVTLTVTDTDFASSTCDTTVTLTDDVPPVLTCPSSSTLECAGPGAHDAARAAWLASGFGTDACAGIIPASAELVSSFSLCPDTVSETWQFTATDGCGNSSSCTRTWSVTDTLPPVVTPPPPALRDCAVAASDLDAWKSLASAVDGCSGARPVVATLADEQRPCPGTVLQTWRFEATDACGNRGAAFSTYERRDTTPPRFTSVPGDAIVSCPAVPPVVAPTVADDCNPLPSLDLQESSQPGPCPQERVIVRTWTADDGCGNVATVSQRITIVDDDAPVLLGVPADTTVSCPSIPAAPVVTASDACDPAPSVTMTESSAPGACPQERTITRTWTARDACGNETSDTQVIQVVDDAPPVLLGVPADATVSCASIPAAPVVTATDACDPAPSVTMTESSAPGTCPQERTITRTWTARDACGNETSDSQVLQVVDDAAPSLSGVPGDQTVSCDAIPPPPPVSATDDCDPSPTVSFSQSSPMPASADPVSGGTRRSPRRGPQPAPQSHCPDHYLVIRTWTATDACGNVTSQSQNLTVVDDVAPSLSGVPGDVTVSCAAVPPPAAVSATDACDPSPAISFDEQRIDGACPNQYALRREWTAIDRCGNARSAVQIVTVTDGDPPTITAPPDAVVECPAPSSGPGSEAAWLALASAADGCGDATVQVREISRTPGCGATYSAVFEFWAVDECFNESPRVQRTYAVEDTTPPSLSAPADSLVECPAPASGPGSEAAWLALATAADGCGDATVQVREVSRTPGCGATYTAVFEFWAVDECLNESPRVQRTYAVEDTTPPVISAPPDQVIECPSPGPAAEAAWLALATAADGCGDATVQVRELSRTPGCGATYTAVFEFWAVDECLNESSRVQRTFAVSDTTPPVFGTPGEQFLLSIWPPNHGYVVYQTADLVTASDACGAVVVQATGCRSSQPEEVHQGPTPDGGNGDGRTFEDCVISTDGTQFAVRAERLGSCGADSVREYSVLFTATDECGNSAPGAGRVVVEHDRSGHQDVRRGRKLGPQDPPPFPHVHPTTYGPGCGP